MGRRAGDPHVRPPAAAAAAAAAVGSVEGGGGRRRALAAGLLGRGAAADARGGFALMAFVLVQEAGAVNAAVVPADGVAVVDRRRVAVPPPLPRVLAPLFRRVPAASAAAVLGPAALFHIVL
jgi:hypothetical protein